MRTAQAQLDAGAPAAAGVPGERASRQPAETVQGRRREMPAEGRTTMGWWAGQLFSWLLLFVVVALLAIMIIVPRVAGATAYTVLTGSMEPGLPPGSLAVVRPVDPAELRTGDVITYQIASGEPAVVTHRIVSTSTTTKGALGFIARGDANGVDDPPVRPEQIRGRLWYHVPLLGHVNTLLTGAQRQWLTALAAAGLLGYAAFMAAGAVRDRRNGGQP